MSKKSEVVCFIHHRKSHIFYFQQSPLGVLLKNEIKNEDMTAVLRHLQQYVPVRSEMDELVDPADGEIFQVFADYFHYVLFGGDQLTAERQNNQ